MGKGYYVGLGRGMRRRRMEGGGDLGAERSREERSGVFGLGR